VLPYESSFAEKGKFPQELAIKSTTGPAERNRKTQPARPGVEDSSGSVKMKADYTE